jgi:HAD domain in Swiss Army Knife RNA repair proteins
MRRMQLYQTTRRPVSILTDLSETSTMEHPNPILPRKTPTLFVDFDGTLHGGHALLDPNGQVSLDSGRPLFEYAPLLVEILKPYPNVEIVLTTSWLDTLPTLEVISYLPQELARRVVDTTRGRKARFSYMQNGSGRTDIITCYAFGKRLEHWLAIDDSVYGAYHFGRVPGELMRNFVLLDATSGISDESAQQRIRDWLVEVHKDGSFQSP